MTEYMTKKQQDEFWQKHLKARQELDLWWISLPYEKKQEIREQIDIDSSLLERLIKRRG